ncbi:MAG: Dna2/Cas4 domain-containing protein, partial [Archaeoglobaceae archaeon]|nr:Dna2/Cas4 domain-containing protein [Archaeoglobaceae archaeon]
MIFYLFLFFLLIAVAILLYFEGRKRRKIPRGRIVYKDAIRLERPIFSTTLQVGGKPDFVIVRGRDYIPIEFKSSKSPMKPYRGHVLQLAAYCWLLEEKTG